jgi:chromosome segregation ATPase
MPERLKELLDHAPQWIMALAAGIAALWAALRAPRRTAAEVEEVENKVDMARLDLVGKSVDMTRGQLEYFERRFEQVSKEAERLRLEGEAFREEIRGLRERAITAEKRAMALEEEVGQVRAELAALKGAPS